MLFEFPFDFFAEDDDDDDPLDFEVEGFSFFRFSGFFSSDSFEFAYAAFIFPMLTFYIDLKHLTINFRHLHFVTEYQKNLNLWSTMDPLSDTVNLVEHLVVLINQITGSQCIRIFWRIKNI